MSQYPVEVNDQPAQTDAINYLLSGPGGLGQNFASFSASENPWSDPVRPYAYLTANFRAPYTQTSPAAMYVAPIALSGAEQIDDRTVKYYFAGAPLAAAPFSLGNGVITYGITPSSFNRSSLRAQGADIIQIGVIECTTSYFIVRTRAPITTPLGTYVSGGFVDYSSTDFGYNSTDCRARVTVSGATDLVVVSGQLDEIISYECFDPSVDFQVTVAINRYVGFPTNDPVNPDFIFDLQDTVISKTYTITGLSGTGELPLIETVFAPVIDQPDVGYYQYFLEVRYDLLPGAGTLQVTQDKVGLRSLTAQVVKQ